MNSVDLRRKFLEFFKKRGHKIVPSSSLLPTDPSVLFTTAGMQQFKPYYLGEKSPFGLNVASVQKCIRTSDIEEVGDESHLTFFEMLGNFSFGGYFKDKAIECGYDFIVKELGLKIDYVSVFSKDQVPNDDWRKSVPEDKESFKIWQNLGVKDIRKEGADNFWGPTGNEGPCGPTTEIYVNGIEIWNIVFNEFFCDKNKKLEKLETPGVDTGMGLERLLKVVNNSENVYHTDLFDKPHKKLHEIFKVENPVKERIILDHLRAATFLLAEGIEPSNKDRGYILRRLIRRSIIKAKEIGVEKNLAEPIILEVIATYADVYSDLVQKSEKIISSAKEEESKFYFTLDKGLRELKKLDSVSGKDAFDLYQTYGFPLEVLEESHTVKNREDFFKELKKHQELSRTTSAGMFKGGLADDKPETVKLHTAHHLLLAALQNVLGKEVKQRGSNINSERLRIDFSFSRKLTDEEKKRAEIMVNEKIREGLEVVRKEMPRQEAEKTGAEMEFGVKYGEEVSVYFIQDKEGNVFSKEFCGGPHIRNTSELGKFKIIKEEAVSSGVRRIKAVLE